VPDPIAVIGATGQQGGAVAAALLDRGAAVRSIARDAGRAEDLERRGAQVAEADLEDGEALRRAFDGVTAVFAMTTMTGPDGTDGEVAHGRAIAEAARDAQVPHLVYSSVGGADRGTGIPHFESKWQVEEYLRELELPAVVLRPTFFMENFLGNLMPQQEDGELVLRAPLEPGVPLQMIAVRDLGRAAAAALLDPEAVPGGAAELAGDERTPEAIADAFAQARMLPGRFEPLSLDVLDDEDMKAMFTWFTTLPAYAADFERSRRLAGALMDLRTFADRHPVGLS
jgi:uncharacterized protein YbjT (DUF2867 family)